LPFPGSLVICPTLDVAARDYGKVAAAVNVCDRQVCNGFALGVCDRPRQPTAEPRRCRERNRKLLNVAAGFDSDVATYAHHALIKGPEVDPPASLRRCERKLGRDVTR